MWQAISEALKSFFEKRLMPTILSIALMCICLFITPEDFTVLVKLEKPLYTLLLFAVCFISVSFVYYIVSQIKSMIAYFRKKAEDARTNMENEKEQLEKIWEYIDSLNPREYQVIVDFLKSKNAPIQVDGKASYSKLFSSCFIISSKIGAQIDYVQTEEEANYDIVSQIIIAEGRYQPVNMCMLDPQAYSMLLVSVRRYNRICNFKTLTPEEIGEDGKHDHK